MGIDFHPLTSPQAKPDRSSAAGQNGSRPATSCDSVGEQLTRDGMVEKLRLQLDEMPEIRHQRVAELRRAIGDNTFQIFPERIAEAMLAEGGGSFLGAC